MYFVKDIRIVFAVWNFTLASTTRSEDSASPTILGIWHVGNQIHRSASARVHLAQPADAMDSPRWDYVIKYSDTNVDPAASLRQIVQSASVCDQVSHPNLVAVLDTSGSGTFPYLVMPRLTGASLQEKMRTETLALPVAFWLARQAAQALDALHRCGWVHGDINPSNIIVGERGHVTLIDMSRATQVNRINSSAVRGSAKFAAPESLQPETAAQSASDVFSLGRVLWGMLTTVAVAHESMLAPAAELIEQMVCENPSSRPTASGVAEALYKQEMATLGTHFQPIQSRRAA